MKIISWLFALIILLVSITLATGYFWLRASLPDYNARYTAPVAHKVMLERDQLGYLTIKAHDRSDAAYGLGFAHAQERFFQMDLTRRSAAGELAELFGEAAVNIDIAHRRHRFRHLAEQQLIHFSADDMQLLSAYSRGVNDGLASLKAKPFEYVLLRENPKAWLEADTLLVIYSMYFDLQGKLGKDEYAMTKLKQALPEAWFSFLQQHSADWQAAIDGSQVSQVPMPDQPYPDILREATACQFCMPTDAVDLGSNNFAVAGQLSQHGAAILADDMHLGLRVPGVWYKTQLNWMDNDQQHQVTGLSLPGTPAIVVGSNGKIAWGFTNSTADWHDLISLRLSDDGQQYLTPQGWKTFALNTEYIRIRGQATKPLKVLTTQWGPVLTFPDNQKYALRWVAHDANAVNLNLRLLEQVDTAEQALNLASVMGIPAQNLLVADHKGHIGWTIFGPIPKRQVVDWDTAQDWSSGENQWGTQLAIQDYPKLLNPELNRLWSANARTVGHEAYDLLGNGGYDLGARGAQIATALTKLQQVDELALHQIQLDHDAEFLKRWQTLLLNTLTDAITSEQQLSAFRQLVAESSLKASPDDIGYTLVRHFRIKVMEKAFAPLSALLEQVGARSADLKYSMETPLWIMLQQQRADTLPIQYSTWTELLVSAAKLAQTEIEDRYGNLSNAKWGTRNTALIEHPLASAIPFFGSWLNMPQQPLAGDSHMPRVQHPDFGQSQRMVVAPGHEEQGILVIPAGQSGHPLSPFYRADHHYWQTAYTLPFLPGPKKYQQQLLPSP